MKKKTTRRDFIKASAITGAAVLAVPSLLDAQTRKSSASRVTAIKPFSAYETGARELLAKMNLEEKVGQMTQPEQDVLKEGECKSMLSARS
jgi:anaerobic selenocysteine-containing dehydrogenase